VTRGQRDGSLLPYCRLSRPEPLLFVPSSSSVVLTRLKYPNINSAVYIHEDEAPHRCQGTQMSASTNTSSEIMHMYVGVVRLVEMSSVAVLNYFWKTVFIYLC
jgi:hypothetical protein